MEFLKLNFRNEGITEVFLVLRFLEGCGIIYFIPKELFTGGGRLMKRLIAFLICIIMLTPGLTALAYNYPSSFWSVNTKYENALNSKDYNGIIEYGNQIINIMKSAPDGHEKRDILATRYKQIGLSYAALEDYDNAAKTFNTLYDYASQYGDEFYDYAKSAKARADQYTSEIKLYTSGGKAPYYGAVNEKRNGVLFGLCSNGGTRSKLDNESMVLTYQELGQKLLTYNEGVIRNASAEGLAVEFALNCPKEGTDIKNIRKMDSYLKEISNLFRQYPNVPIYLRFAAEFNIWSTLAGPEEYKAAFRYVSEYFKNRNDNVAIVWSPNHVSNWYINLDDYYPGDEYVDWVGISLYAQKYFLGDPNQKEENEIAFKTGINSDPVIAVKELVEKYGKRKPIMLSESGCGHKLVKRGENTTEFALQRLKEQYSYLPMVYPQIKLIAYFDWYVDADKERDDFRLSTNSKLQNEYLKLIKGQRFIQNKYCNNTDFCYRQINNGTKVENVFDVSCYAHLHNSNVKSVTYYIDGKYAGMSDEIPYTTMIDASGYTGTHRLKAIAAFNNGKTLVTESDIHINNTSRKITVEIDDERIRFDQEPILYNSRTMVPMRKIFEELGAKVTWDDNSQTATGQKGDRRVRVTVGQKMMYVNNKAIELDTAPFVLSGRTLVPARAIAEGMGCEVDWDDRYSLVSITPKVFRWSEWDEDLPSYVDEDLYYIEERTEYRVRTREKEYFTLDYKINSSNYIGEETSYGNWSDWDDDYISSSSTREVQTRTQSSPKQYYYAHYCTGNERDEEIRYKTSNHEFSDKCDYHSLGWYDSPLPPAEDGTGYIKYKDDGNKYRCANSCYRWYVLDTEGGEYTEYRYRPIYTQYRYWEWSDWSRWSSWDDEDPYDYYDWYDKGIDVDERTIYRYKEKG